ncbi:retron Se72 family effector protein [Paraburkholderia sediminicola]|uniref:retron Se72 family effector protein n=1 Tax=Paraburkholderia TaxID=1822464 RepID=UPI0038B6EC76
MTNQSDDFHYGTVKAYYPIKGFGFISREKGKDVFFLYDAVKDEADVFEGSKVKFLIEQAAKGPRALKIERVG